MEIYAVAAVNITLVIAIIVLAVLTGILIAMTIWGNKQKKKADEAQKQMEETAQPISLLVIDKKKMRIRDAGLPKIVMDNIPKRMRRNKVPIVKAKAGPKIMSFMCDEKVFDTIPVKQEIKAMVSGIYIISVKGLRGAVLSAPEKKGFFSRIMNR